MKEVKLKFHHIGIPTQEPREGEVHYPDKKLFYCSYENNEYRIEWLRHEADADVPELIRTVAHVAYEVDDIHEAVKGKKILIPPVEFGCMMIAFIEENGAPIEFIQEVKKDERD